jgi:hypothetical protein
MSFGPSPPHPTKPRRFAKKSAAANDVFGFDPSPE